MVKWKSHLYPFSLLHDEILCSKKKNENRSREDDLIPIAKLVIFLDIFPMLKLLSTSNIGIHVERFTLACRPPKKESKNCPYQRR